MKSTFLVTACLLIASAAYSTEAWRELEPGFELGSFKTENTSGDCESLVTLGLGGRFPALISNILCRLLYDSWLRKTGAKPNSSIYKQERKIFDLSAFSDKTLTCEVNHCNFTHKESWTPGRFMGKQSEAIEVFQLQRTFWETRNNSKTGLRTRTLHRVSRVFNEHKPNSSTWNI